MAVQESAPTATVLLCGVGGQGTILAADLLAKTAIASGADVKLSEIHGMSQRGGAVVTVVRIGRHVASMVADAGCADHIVSFETTEALRNLPYLKKDGRLLVNDVSVEPLPVLAGNAAMPEGARDTLRELGARLIPATDLARAAGNSKAANVVLLGALAAGLGFEGAQWESQIALRVPPATVEANLAAFRAGWDHAGRNGGDR